MRLSYFLFACYAVSLVLGCAEDPGCPSGTRKLGTRCIKTADAPDASVDGELPQGDAGAAPDAQISEDACGTRGDCADAGELPLCATMACPAEAFCEIEGGEAVCRCKPDYVGDGQTCVRSECAPEAESPPCGGHATCEDPSLALGDFACTCEAGYTNCGGEGATSCVDLLSDADHCGACGSACAGDLSCVEGACQQAAAALVLGGDTSCALLNPPDQRGAHELRCWGNNESNQLRTGDGSAYRAEPGPLAKIPRARALSIGWNYVCALDDDTDGIYCWGDNTYQQLGSEDTNIPNTELVSVSKVPRAAELAAGTFHTCARAAGKVLCWGFHQLQASNSTFRTTEVPNIADAVQVETSAFLTCVRRASGRAACWGLDYGATPTDIVDGSGRVIDDFSRIAVGANHACGVRASGEVGCWGDRAMLGVPPESVPTTYSDTLHYVRISSLSNVVDVAAGYMHTCAIDSEGQAYCWGGNSNGELGVDANSEKVLTPLPVPAVKDALDIEAGAVHTCVRRRSGQVSCWGDNSRGALGDGTAITPPGAVNVVGLP